MDTGRDVEGRIRREQSVRYQDYTAATHERATNRLWAFKHLMSRNIGIGELALGAEYTATHRHTTFSGYASVLESTNDKIHDYNLAAFADWQMKLSEHTKWGIGLRYEHIIYDFFEDQIKSDMESKVYNNIFPTISFSSAIGQVNYGFDYHVRTIRPAYEMLSLFCCEAYHPTKFFNLQKCFQSREEPPFGFTDNPIEKGNVRCMLALQFHDLRLVLLFSAFLGVIFWGNSLFLHYRFGYRHLPHSCHKPTQMYK